MDKDTRELFQQVIERLDEIKANMQAQSLGINKPVKKGSSLNPPDNYVDIESICQILKISKDSLRRYRKQGLIPFYKIGGKVYFLESEVKEALKKHYYGG